ncbi:hypothetical protein [Streptomyces sp. NPDC048248]|uniref:hypothetical protein n=1 Tax=Streptomyces sp. NPDC048248 TaxID=3365523 RepID=UPI003712C0CD
MPRSMALAKGARITGGAFCLLFFLYTAYWLAIDVDAFGLDGLFDIWTGGRRGGPDQVTIPFHLGLAVVQLAAAWAAFAGLRTAGGLLAVAGTFTFVMSLQAIASTGSATDQNRWFLIPFEQDSSTFTGVFLSALCLVPLALAACVVLLAGMRSWPRQRPSDPPMRPAKVPGTVAGLILGAMVLLYVAWNIYWLVENGLGSADVFYLGTGILTSLLDVSPGLYYVTLIGLSAAAALSCLARGGAARGLAMGLATLLLPNALLSVIGMGNSGTLFEFGSANPGFSVLVHLGLVLSLFGSLALFALMGRGEPVAPGWHPPVPAPQFGVPGMMPPGPQGPPPAGWQQPGPPMPQQGPPMPQVGNPPPMPPGNPPAPQGGFGPPQY